MSNEISLRKLALNDQNIFYMMLGEKCGESRKSGTFKCNGNCVDRFPTATEGFESIKKLRLSLWIDPESLAIEHQMQSNKGLDIRKSSLIKLLVGMTVMKESGEQEINFNITGVRVCKNFFFRATGFTQKLFNNGVSFVLNKSNDQNDTDAYFNLSQKPIFLHICGVMPSFTRQIAENSISSGLDEDNNSTLNVTSFLDTFFSAHTDVDHAPEERNVKFVRLNWNKVYEDYRNNCKLVLCNPVCYPKFASIR